MRFPRRCPTCNGFTGPLATFMAGINIRKCCCYRQARNCADNTTQNVWMKSSNASSYTGAFKIGTSTCYYFNFADSPSSSPGTLYGPSDVTATGASCAALCPTMTPACAGVATLAVVTATGLNVCVCADNAGGGGPFGTGQSFALITGNPNGVWDLARISSTLYRFSTSALQTQEYSDHVCGAAIAGHISTGTWTLGKGSDWTLTLSVQDIIFQAHATATACDISLDFTNSFTSSACNTGNISMGYGGACHVDFFA